jgi:antitoxin component of RelBE/YafQ-DinJ toxin-antitoxin module
MNLTLSVDERIVEQARKAAQSMGKSLNQAVRDYLEQLAGQAQRETVIKELRELSMTGQAPKGQKGSWKFDREEVYTERLDRRHGN